MRRRESIRSAGSKGFSALVVKKGQVYVLPRASFDEATTWALDETNHEELWGILLFNPAGEVVATAQNGKLTLRGTRKKP